MQKTVVPPKLNRESRRKMKKILAKKFGGQKKLDAALLEAKAKLRAERAEKKRMADPKVNPDAAGEHGEFDQ